MLSLRTISQRLPRQLSVLTPQIRSFSSLNTRLCSARNSHHSTKLTYTISPVTVPSRTFFWKDKGERVTVPVDLNKLTFREQCKALSFTLLFKQYGLHMIKVYTALYLSNFAASYGVATFFDVTAKLREVLSSVHLDSMVALMDKYADYGDFITAFVINDCLDVVRVPVFIWYAVRYIKNSGELPLVYKDKLPSHYQL